jgi:hypothetical protein
MQNAASNRHKGRHTHTCTFLQLVRICMVTHRVAIQTLPCFFVLSPKACTNQQSKSNYDFTLESRRGSVLDQFLRDPLLHVSLQATNTSCMHFFVLLLVRFFSSLSIPHQHHAYLGSPPSTMDAHTRLQHVPSNLTT